MPSDRDGAVPAIPQVHQGKHPGPDPADDRGAAAAATAHEVKRRSAARVSPGALQRDDRVSGDANVSIPGSAAVRAVSIRPLCTTICGTFVNGGFVERRQAAFFYGGRESQRK